MMHGRKNIKKVIKYPYNATYRLFFLPGGELYILDAH